MSDQRRTISVPMPTDEKGRIGRQCAACGQYFQLKPGTGLPISTTRCPYCGHSGAANDFLTPDQVERLKSVATREVLGPLLRQFQQNIQRLDSPYIRVTTRPIHFGEHSYSERDLETDVLCDGCGLDFAIYGVFAQCPDCGRLNALTVFAKSLDVVDKRLRLAEQVDVAESELREGLVRDALGSACSVFDALGKALRERYPHLLPAKPQNLFQNVDELGKALQQSTGRSLTDILGPGGAAYLRTMFQVRHLMEHNLGVVDEKAVAKVPELVRLRGRKYPLAAADVERLNRVLHRLGPAVVEALEAAGAPDGHS